MRAEPLRWVLANSADPLWPREDFGIANTVHVERLRCTPADLGVTTDQPYRVALTTAPLDAFPRSPWVRELPGKAEPVAVLFWHIEVPDGGAYVQVNAQRDGTTGEPMVWGGADGDVAAILLPHCYAAPSAATTVA